MLDYNLTKYKNKIKMRMYHHLLDGRVSVCAFRSLLYLLFFFGQKKKKNFSSFIFLEEKQTLIE